MSNTENPNTENLALEQEDEGEDSSGLKVRTSLKAGADASLVSLGLVGVRGGIRTEDFQSSAYVSTAPVVYTTSFRPTF